MATENKPNSNTNKGKKRKQRYLPHNKPVKKKGSYPLRPGVQGFFITCDGGRELQASREAINVIDTFYEELVSRKDTSTKLAEQPKQPLNKRIKFTYSDDEEEDDDYKEKGEEDEVDEEDDDDDGEEEEQDGEGENKPDPSQTDNSRETDEKSGLSNMENLPCSNHQGKQSNDTQDVAKDHTEQANEADEPATKKQSIDSDSSKGGVDVEVEKSIDKLIEDELNELGDRNKRLFISLDSGCNGVVFIQMCKRDGDPSPKDIVQHMMTSAASTRKHMSRFILRVLPIEVACYSSEEEISRAIAPLVAKYFPVDAQEPIKFAVLYEARANTGIDRMKIINAVAKSVPAPHKVDLGNPDKTIVLEIARTVCLIGVIEKYKELSKYNLRQLTSPRG